MLSKLKTLKMSAINNENAKLLINLLERLPMDIYSEIMEFNPEHREKMNEVFCQMIRFVFCQKCGVKKEIHVLFKQIHLERTDTWLNEDDLTFCAECYQNECDFIDSICWDGRGTPPWIH